MKIKSLKNSFYNTLILHHPSFNNENVERLYNFIVDKNNNIRDWNEEYLSEFTRILKNFKPDDIQYFFENINQWDSYYLVIIADKILNSNVKAQINYDLGRLYCKIFCSYEKFDSYYLIDNLEFAISMYHSKLNLSALTDLNNKIELLYQNDSIKSQQYQSSLDLLKKLQNEL
ncbi:hypothetical protein [Chryseobacterium sp.]|uniref:hypothetical protein n=1 Tax=Chryseobacterium sp. TaxID=1871047 RepID=UPI0025BAE383|nr:hypothetical protein [Chryseobacterium sp.]